METEILRCGEEEMLAKKRRERQPPAARPTRKPSFVTGREKDRYIFV